MTSFDFTNFGNSALANGLTPADTVGTLSLGTGALMPQLSDGNEFTARITDAATMTINEVVYVTNIAGDVITMVRGREGTNAATWASGALFIHTPSANAISSFLQKTETQAPQRFDSGGGIAISAGGTYAINGGVTVAPYDGNYLAIGYANYNIATMPGLDVILENSLTSDNHSGSAQLSQTRQIVVPVTKGQSLYFSMVVIGPAGLNPSVYCNFGFTQMFWPASS